MDMTGEYRIPASREKVWQALNDPQTLKASLPGCESLEKISDKEFAATVVAKVGPVKAKFNGNVTLSNLNPPESYTISGEGKGGAAGFAKGGADVRLAEEGEATVLTYTAKADVGGKLAQLGSRLIDGTAKKMADEFFGNFSQQVAPAAPEAAAEPAPRAPVPAAPAESLLQNKFVWAAAAIVVLMILVLLFR
jgi:carbon monoxide dehydrogenase subunit G